MTPGTPRLRNPTASMGTARGTSPCARLQTRQRGSITALSACTLMMMIGFCGLALELSQVYNRKVELAGLAKSVAKAAARELNGTPAGIDNAITQAKKIVAASSYGYGNNAFSWSDSLVTFSSSPKSSSWVGAGEAKGAQAVTSTFFVKVNTSALGSVTGRISMVLMPVLSSSLSSVTVSEVAIAGRGSIKAIPLAVCAMSPTPAAKRVNTVMIGTVPTTLNELVEYGFRRGISYDLMQLNSGTTTADNFVIDPYIGPGLTSASVNTAPAAVSPFVCTGKMWMPTVLGGTIRVARPFPLANLYKQLNSRFDIYDSTAPDNMRCTPRGAPPDVNIKWYSPGTGISWMSPTQVKQSPDPAPTAASGTEPAKLQSNADLSSMPSGQNASMYGPIWSYSRAVPFNQYVAGVPEPANGYTPFAASDWAILYKPIPANTTLVAASAPGYPSPTPSSTSTPYTSGTVSMTNTPLADHKLFAQRNRRVLYVPLLYCPVAAGASSTATVAAIGKFFMTVPATDKSLTAEFAGIVPLKNLAGDVEIYE